MAAIVLDKCISRKEVDNNGTPYTTHIIYNYEFIDDFEEPQLGRVGKFLLQTVLRYKSQERDTPLVITNHLLENGNLSLLSSTESVIPTKQSSVLPSTRKISAIPLAKNWGPTFYEKGNHTLSLMVRVTPLHIHRLEHQLNHNYTFSIEGRTKKNQITTASISYRAT